MGKTSPPERRELLELLRQNPRGSANRQRQRIE
ncbi:MAG: PAP fibrillin, partial [Synechococcaceae bacterium WB7_3xG_012]|nr:PAP fibrillin [Synechococcaceae bacterium WB7_3xG_012]